MPLAQIQRHGFNFIVAMPEKVKPLPELPKAEVTFAKRTSPLSGVHLDESTRLKVKEMLVNQPTLTHMQIASAPRISRKTVGRIAREAR